MSIRALQDYVYVSRYARYNKKTKKRSTFEESVDVVKDMHSKKYSGCGIEGDIQWAFDMVKEKRVLGSQRALQFGGKPIQEKNARIYNCTASYCDRIRFFQECFWLLLCGCGTGFSVQKHHIARLPAFARNKHTIKHFKTYVVEDSIEGWADALGVLLATYFYHEEFSEWINYEVSFDFSKIRKEGSELASGVGKAPGPEPLLDALVKIRRLLNRCIENGQDRLRPIDAYDIMMYASDAVLSGGVRRSATICLFSPDDYEMATAKTGNWFADNPQRGRSNNSALLLRNKTTKEQFQRLMESVKEFGEPGFVWADSTEIVVNPCVEIGMYPVHKKTGRTGWQGCNLSEINGKKVETKEDFAIAARAAAIIGTLQAGYTSFAYLGKTSEEIFAQEALLGVSITGMMDNPDVIFNEEIQREMAQLVLDVNAEIAEKIGINPAARATCVKPAGSTSCILGSSSGIHLHHAKRYFRRVQGNRTESPLQYFKKFNPLAVEKSVWSANGTDEIVTFCIEVPKESMTKNDMGAVDFLKKVKSTQNNWVAYGKRENLCTQPWLSHNVSNTINVKPEEWEPVTDYLYEERASFAGVSLLGVSGDLDYPQAPMCAVHTPDEIASLYGEGSMMASGLIVDGLRAFNQNLWAACDAVNGFGTPAPEMKAPRSLTKSEKVKNFFKKTASKITFGKLTPWKSVPTQESVDKYKEIFEAIETIQKFQEDWIRRAKQFAERYFKGDIKKMSHCLKEVHNWKLWCDLNREYVDVDFSGMIEERDETQVQREWACSGGLCEVR